MSNQQATVNEQPSSQINHSKQVPFGLLLPILIPQLAKDRAMQLTTLFNKLKKDEIPKDHFVRLMKGIVGDQMLRIALTKVKQQTKANAGSSGQQHPVRMPTVTSSGTKFNDPHALAQLHQRSMNPATDHSHNTSSAIQVKSEPTYSTVDIGAKKSLEHDVRVLQPNQLPSSGSNAFSQETERSSVHIQGLNKQQQQHIHFPSTYGSSGGNYNHFSGTTTGSSSLKPQPHPHDSHIRQIPHQNIGLNHLGVERQSSFTDPKRMPAEQNSGLFSSVSYVKKEPNNLSIEQQHRNHLSKLHGLPSVNSGQTEQGSGVNQGTVKDEFSRGSLALTSMPHTTSSSLPTSSSASQLDPTSQTQFDNPNDSNMEEMPIVLTRLSLKLSCTLIQTLAINTRLSLVGRLKLQKGNLSNQNKEAVQVELTDKWYLNMPFLDVPLLRLLKELFVGQKLEEWETED
ncbi:unnamed protein product [Vicia faba]|uniref:RST domain-containing protein n=1 Tax=Vicia faba TaxID=3906 RepID=A0AAV1ARI5_VICFA|nr:unnamed protein product [Vicia faba]